MPSPTGTACAATLVHDADEREDTVSALLVLLLIAIVIGVYYVSLRLNPWVKCSKCHGKQRFQGWVFSHAHHNCPKCGGTGRQLRLGYRWLRMDRGNPPP
jgi:DnaJ-class molecular chaperone